MARLPDPQVVSLGHLPDMTLPPLPPVADADLGRLAFTHSSHHQGSRSLATSLETGSDLKVEDYEKLEHVGDAILGTIITTLLHDLFPTLQPGPSTVLKSCLVANSTLAELSSRYHLPDNLIASASALLTTRMQVKTKASIFEAYVAAVFYDFLTSDVPGVYALQNGIGGALSAGEATPDGGSVADDMTESPPESMESDDTKEASKVQGPHGSADGYRNGATEAPASDATGVETNLPPLAPLRPRNMRTRGEAYDYVERWLRPLFTPVAHFALETARAASAARTSTMNNTVIIAGAAGALNQYVQQHHRCTPIYTPSADGSRWRMVCRVLLSDGTEYLADAVGDSKKVAMNYAAYEVCKMMGIEGV